MTITTTLSTFFFFNNNLDILVKADQCCMFLLKLLTYLSKMSPPPQQKTLYYPKMIARCRRNSFQLHFIRVVLVRLVHVVVLIKPIIVLYLNGPVLEVLRMASCRICACFLVDCLFCL